MSAGFIVLIFIVILVVVMLTDNWITSALIISLLANFALMVRPDLLENLEEKKPADAKPKLTEAGKAAAQNIEKTAMAKQAIDVYGPWHEQYNAYTRSYDFYDPVRPVVGYSCGERNYTIDSANALMAQQRARDKKCMDGMVLKDAGFYRHHFADELDKEENKAWWSATEF